MFVDQCERIQREELCFSMKKPGVADMYGGIVQDMYESYKTVVRCTAGVAEKFEVVVGLH